MATEVKRLSKGVSGRTRISSKHQITVPIDAFSEAGLHEGDIVRVTAAGRGRVQVARVEDLIDEYAGCLSSAGELGRTVRELRGEWPQS